MKGPENILKFIINYSPRLSQRDLWIFARVTVHRGEENTETLREIIRYRIEADTNSWGFKMPVWSTSKNVNSQSDVIDKDLV